MKDPRGCANRNKTKGMPESEKRTNRGQMKGCLKRYISKARRKNSSMWETCVHCLCVCTGEAVGRRGRESKGMPWRQVIVAALRGCKIDGANRAT
eukprot:2998392-Amphidinium_carterae.1